MCLDFFTSAIFLLFTIILNLNKYYFLKVKECFLDVLLGYPDISSLSHQVNLALQNSNLLLEDLKLLSDYLEE